MRRRENDGRMEEAIMMAKILSFWCVRMGSSFEDIVATNSMRNAALSAV